jgi:hypothetical protein
MNSPSQPHAAGQAAHTPTPWKDYRGKPISGGAEIWAKGERGTSFCVADTAKVTDAAFIIRACNSHAALVEALERVTGELHGLIKDEQDEPAVGITGWNSLHESVAAARAALALAKGTPTAAQAVKSYLDSKQPFAS